MAADASVIGSVLGVDDIDFGVMDDSTPGAYTVDQDGNVIIDRDASPNGEPLKSGRERLKAQSQRMLERDAKTGIPTLDEWMHFFSRVVIRMAMNFYIDLAFRGVDEDLLSDREVERISMTDKERDRIARPFAELAYKTKFTRKHGRSIIATADSLDAIVQLGMWYSRVSRIAAKYKGSRESAPPRRAQRASHRVRPVNNIREQPRTVHVQEPAEEERDERTFTSPPSGHEPGWRPRIAGQHVYNPNAG